MDRSRLDESHSRASTKFDTVLKELPRSTAPRIEGWSDDILLDLRKKVKFSNHSLNRASRLNVYCRFYDFYFHGIVDEEDNIVAIVSDASCLSRTQHGSIWLRQENIGEEFHALNRSKKTILSTVEVSPLPQLVFLSPSITQEQREAYSALLSTYDDLKAREFRASVIRILSNYDPTAERTNLEKSLQMLTGFLALTLWRASIKNKDQLGNAFLKNQYRSNLSTLASWPHEFPFSPPCERCIELCVGALSKGTKGTSAMFTILAAEYVKSRKSDYEDQFVAGYLSASILTHTARNGLGILQMMEQACIITRKDWTELFDMSYLNITSASWDSILQFFIKYLTKDKIEFGFNWARIINDGYLRDYSPKEMLYLAGIFAGIIEQSQGVGIWEAEWAKLHKEHLRGMRDYGIAIYKLSGPDLDKAIASSKGERVLNLAKTLAREEGLPREAPEDFSTMVIRGMK